MLPGRNEIEKFFFNCHAFISHYLSVPVLISPLSLLFPPLFFFLFLCNWICLGVSGRDGLWVCEKISRHLEGF